jgi:hypothetical protein
MYHHRQLAISSGAVLQAGTLHEGAILLTIGGMVFLLANCKGRFSPQKETLCQKEC